MDLKNAKNANFLQIDREIKNISTPNEKEFLILPIKQVYKESVLVRKYFKNRVNQGYFLSVRKNTREPIFVCFSLVTKKSKQEPKNIIIIKRNVSAEIISFCNAVSKKINGVHKGETVIILEKGASLKINVFHKWGENDEVETKTLFLLAENSELVYSYIDANAPKKLLLANKSVLGKEAKSFFETNIYSLVGMANINEEIKLSGEKSGGISKLKLVAGGKAKIKSVSKIIAEKDNSVGHTECSGLIINGKASIDTIPELVNKNKTSILTHEASVGRISEKVLNYLKSRGLSEKKAVNLVVSGFLEEEKGDKYFKNISKM